MDALASTAQHARVRVLPHIKKLDLCFGQFRGIHAFSLACGGPYSSDSPIRGNGATAR